MATLSTPLNPSHDNSIENALATVTSNLASNPNVARFTVKVNKKSGSVVTNAVAVDGTTRTQEMLSVGLQSTMTYNPSDRNSRNAAVFKLKAEGYTQTEIAMRLGVSQALVSKILAGSA